MTWLKDLKVGDTVYYVPSDKRWRKPKCVNVDKVGRKWITLGDYAGRVDIHQNLRNDAAYVDHTFGSPDSIYFSQEAFEYAQTIAKIYRDVCEAVSVRGNLTDVQIKEIANVLGVNTNGTL